MANATLEGATLRRANLENADLAGTILDNSKLKDAKSIRVNMDECSLVGRNLR